MTSRAPSGSASSASGSRATRCARNRRPTRSGDRARGLDVRSITTARRRADALHRRKRRSKRSADSCFHDLGAGERGSWHKCEGPRAGARPPASALSCARTRGLPLMAG
jgi:hypothetical protein